MSRVEDKQLVRRKGGAHRFPRKTLSGKSIRIRRDIGAATRHAMMDGHSRTFRPESNNDNIQIDVRECFRNAIPDPAPLTLCKQTQKTDRLLSISVIEISITDVFFLCAHLSFYSSITMSTLRLRRSRY